MIDPSLLRIPHLGAGLGHRREIHDGILAAKDDIGFVEIIPEKYISASRRTLDALAALTESFVIIPHGVSLSVGTASPVSKSFLREIRRVCDIVSPPYYSDHLAVTRSAGVDIGHLSPLVYTKGHLAFVVDNIRRVQDAVGLPFVIENITETHQLPGSTMDTADFLGELVRRSGCGLLLDVTNLHINSVNLGFDAIDYARRLPLDAVVQLHLAGGIWDGSTLIDSHSEAVPEKVWELFEALLPEMPALKGVIIERDDNFPSFDHLLKEVRRIDRTLSRHGVLACAA